MKVVGILGGMGPMATLDLSKKIVENTLAKTDQDHVHLIIDNNCEIPDRTNYILGRGEDPTPYMIESAKKLEKAGADFIVIPCNTAHYFYSSVSSAINIPIVNMVEEVANYLLGEDRVGLMATRGTYKGEVYNKVFTKKNIEIVIPNKETISKVGDIIYRYKSSEEIEEIKLIEIEEFFKKERVEKVILGCTELPLIYSKYRGSVRYIDPTEILSRAVIKRAGKKVVGGTI